MHDLTHDEVLQFRKTALALLETGKTIEAVCNHFSMLDDRYMPRFSANDLQHLLAWHPNNLLLDNSGRDAWTTELSPAVEGRDRTTNILPDVHACKVLTTMVFSDGEPLSTLSNPVPACEVLKPPSATTNLSASASSIASDSTIRLPTNPLPAPSNVDFRGDEPRPTSMSIRLLHRRRMPMADRLHWVAGLAFGVSTSLADRLGSRPQPSGCGWGYPSSVAPAAGPQPLTPAPTPTGPGPPLLFSGVVVGHAFA